MVIKFAGVGKSITEIPVRLSRDGRNRKPHLRSFRDGFRHLKLMIAMSPQFVLLLPGFLISVVSFFATGLTLIGITELSESNLVYQIVALDFGLIMICFGAIAIAHRKSQGINRFKWSLIQFSKKREIFAIAAPILMILASLFVANTESNFDRQIMYLISYVLLLGAFQLLMAALIVRQILSPIWKKD
jgi:hypothetical protein